MKRLIYTALAILVIIVAVLIAIDKANNSVYSKIIHATLIITLISSIVHIARCDANDTYFASIREAYDFYHIEKKMHGGGVWGALFGGLLLLVTGGSKIAAIIILLLVLFVTIMVLTGMTLGNLFNGLSKPVKKIGEFTGEKINEYNEKTEHRNQIKDKQTIKVQQSMEEENNDKNAKHEDAGKSILYIFK